MDMVATLGLVSCVFLRLLHGINAKLAPLCWHTCVPGGRRQGPR
jgi:hypothetical protein